MKTLAVGCLGAIVGLVLGILLTFGAWSLWTRTNPSPQSAPILDASRGDVTLTISANYLNARLQHIVKQTGLVKQATLTLLAPDIAQINATMDAKILGQTISGSALARVRIAVQNGRVLLTIEKVDVSGIGISQSFVTPVIEQLRAQMEDQINKVIQRELQGMGLRLVNIQVMPNRVTVDLTAQ